MFIYRIMENSFAVKIGDIIINVTSDVPFSLNTFTSSIKKFFICQSNKIDVYLNHHSYLPFTEVKSLGIRVYSNPPYDIYESDNLLSYIGIDNGNKERIQEALFFSKDFSVGEIYRPSSESFQAGNCNSISFLTTDQVFLSSYLSNHQGCLLHSSGVILGGKGFIFAAHSGGGKSTIVKMLQNEAEILCDDRIILRSFPRDVQVYGTWSHGEVPDVSPNNAPLNAIFFLEKSDVNSITPITDTNEIIKQLLLLVIKPMVTKSWYDSTFDLLLEIIKRVPCYRLQFDRSADIKNIIGNL
jgi:hypothetical protein